MERRKFTREFKLEAVKLVKDRGVSYARAAEDLGVHPTQLRNWVKALANDPEHSFPGQGQMKPVNVGAAAIDIGSTMHMAAVDPACADTPVRAFGTFTQDLHELADWFKVCGVTSVAMESTGVYWIPAYEILEQHGFEVILVNARYA